MTTIGAHAVGWLSPVEIAARLDLPDEQPVLEALRRAGLAESRAHSAEAWAWHRESVSHRITTPTMREALAGWLASMWDQVAEDVGESSTTWRCSKRIRLYSPAAVRIVEREIRARARPALCC